MKNKIYLIFIILGSFSSMLSAQNQDTLILIKGYSVYSCSKERLNSIYEQDYLNAKAEITKQSYKKMRYIDGVCGGHYFVPTQIGNVKIDPNVFMLDFTNNIRTDTLFVSFLSIDYGCIECSEKEKISIARDELKLSVAQNNFSPYYDFGKSVKKIVYIEGYARYFNKKNKNNPSIVISILHPYECNNLFIITKITNYSTIIDLPNLKVWYPYLEEETE